MKATNEELIAIAEYYDALFIGQNFKEKFINLETNQEKVQKLDAVIKQVAKSFFLENLEYDNIVYRVAKRLDIELKSEAATDINEIEIALKFIWNSFSHISAEQKAEMVELLGCKYSKSNTKLKETIDGTIRANIHSSAKMYTFAAWMTDTVQQSFVKLGIVWESNGRIARFFRILLGGGVGFRAGLIFPILHIGMLRQKQRQGKAVKRA